MSGQHRLGPLPDDWTLPAVEAVNRAWFTSGAITLQQCAGCGTLQHPPEEICHVCGAMTFSPRAVAPTGIVHSYTVVHHSVHPSLDRAVPYAVVLVALDGAPSLRVVGNLLGVPVDEVAIGLPVVATWEELPPTDGEPLLLPQWQRQDQLPQQT
ncbi:MAG: DNA-binding protein [Frankiales bacterium]|nr:DNA-binding protein [Frankiales bacterium]